MFLSVGPIKMVAFTAEYKLTNSRVRRYGEVASSAEAEAHTQFQPINEAH